MERASGSNEELQSMLQAVRSSDVVENRVQMLTKLGDLELSEISDLASLVGSLTTFWEDFTCLDVSQCILNKTILHVAAKYLESDVSGCLVQFLTLGTKAGEWCGKHLNMTLMSSEESQEEEHSSHFYQLLLDFFRFSSSCFSALMRYPVLEDKVLMVIVEKFILGLLNLMKDAVSEVKRINLYGSEVLKVAPTLIEAAIRLCEEYSKSINWELCDATSEKDKGNIDCEEAIIVNHVINIINCTIGKLCDLGVLAANDGGNLVTILNVSWKGVVTLLQLGKGSLAVKVNVADIILTLISLVRESLRCAAEAWSSLLTDTITVQEAKRTFLPVKFYLINAVKITSRYPCQAYLVYKEIALCVLMISMFRIFLSKEKLLKTVAEMLAELLENTSFQLILSMLNSAQLKQELKFEILDWLFIDESLSSSIYKDPISDYRTSMDAVFCVNCKAIPGARILLLGRVALFLHFLSSLDLEEDVRLGITRKLKWLLDIVVDEEVYSSILVLQSPVSYGCKQNLEIAWQSMFFSLLHALKTFLIVGSSSLVWGELESFLLENFLHPHFLCWEIVMELWCFMLRYSTIDTVDGIVDKLFSVFKLVASSESVLIPGSAMRKMARSICMLLSHGAQSMVDRVYNSVVRDDKSQLSSFMYLALIIEGFPLKLLSDNIRSIANKKIMTDYFNFIESFDEISYKVCSSAFGVPVFALSASLQSLQPSTTNVDTKTLKFLCATIHTYKNSVDSLVMDQCRKFLSETLGIISNMKHLYASDGMEEVILELQNLFISGPAASDTQLSQCKPYLGFFLAGLGHMDLTKSDENAKGSAVWELYHMLLRERHWAIVHLAIAAFGYFAARTSCNELWRFVPQDAALSYDLMSGKEANLDRFMSELKVFLEKEMALRTNTPCAEQLGLLLKEGLVLKEMVQKIKYINTEDMKCESIEISGEQHANKRRKLPDGISEGMELLQSGLKVIGDGLSRWQKNHSDSTELHDKFLTHFSRLEDEIAHLAGLASLG